MSYSLAFTQSLYMLVYVTDKIQQGFFEFTPTAQISEDLNIPPSTARLILGRLSRASIIETKEGAGGGVRLAIPADELDLLMIFQAIEHGKAMFNTGVSLKVEGKKPTRAGQEIRQILNNAEQAMFDNLATVKLSDMVESINND